MNIYGYEHEEDLKPQLKKTGTLTLGMVLSIATLVLYMLYIAFYSTQSPFNINYGLSTGITAVIGISYIGVIISFIPYLSNFNMQSIKTIAYVIVILHIISVLMKIGFFALHKAMEDSMMSVSTWAQMTNAIYMIINLIFSVVSILFGGMMIANKSDFVGGIRFLGGVIIATTLSKMFIYIFQTFALPYIIMGMENNEGVASYYSILSSVSMVMNMCVIATYLYVFVKAWQYSSANR